MKENISCFQIRLGEHDLTTSGEGTVTEIDIAVTNYTNHESYSYPSNDITVIELAQEVDLNIYTPACLAKTTDTTAFEGKMALVYGDMNLHEHFLYLLPRLGSSVL